MSVFKKFFLFEIKLFILQQKKSCVFMKEGDEDKH